MDRMDLGPYFLEDSVSSYGRASSNEPWSANLLEKIESPDFCPQTIYDISREDITIGLKLSGFFRKGYDTVEYSLVEGVLFANFHADFCEAYMKVIYERGWKIEHSYGLRLFKPVGANKYVIPSDGTLFLSNEAGEKCALTFSNHTGPYYSMCVCCDASDSAVATAFSGEYIEGLMGKLDLKNSLLVQDDEGKLKVLDKMEPKAIILPESLEETIRRNVDVFFDKLDLFAKHGVNKKRGLLFHGDPGVGKTSAIRNIVNRMLGSITIISVSSVNVARYITTVLGLASKLSPTLLIIEDIDFLASRDQPQLCELLDQLDGLQEREGVVIIATTNSKDEIDEALSRRPGRFDVDLEFSLPNLEDRTMALKMITDSAQMENADIKEIAKETSNYSYAHLKEIVDRIVMMSLLNEGKSAYKKEYLEEAMKNLPKRSSGYIPSIGFRKHE